MSFRDLVGQDHVAQTLANAIAADRVAHAFLFTGVRGVGKTTSARILAKALNCIGPKDAPLDGPTAEPCLECAACLEIAKGTDLDVQEIDGASYNGVDEVRRLQDSLPYRPTRDRYKIIIVDEVHMLSQAAWNAFLKTLEEPPPHVKFIFATTEVHKVPVTILSRVQRFDFKMISARAIGERIRFVLTEEKIEADDMAISIVARSAGGSMRDAMSLLDQVIAFGGGTLHGPEVARVLGVVGTRALSELALSTIDHKPGHVLERLERLAEEGFDMIHLARDLLALFRDLVVAKVAPHESGLIDRTAEEQTEIRSLVTHTSEQDLIRLHQSFSRSFDDVARSTDPRSGLEMLLVRMALRPDLLPVDELLHRLAHLERRLMGEGGGRRLAPSNDTQKRGPIERPEREVPNSAGAPRPRDARPAANKSSTGITEALEDPDPAAPPLAVQAKAPHKPPLDETRTSDAATAPIEQPVPVTQPAGPAPMARPAEKPSETAVPSETEPKGESPPHQAAAKEAVQPTRDPSPPQPFTAPPAAEIIEISERVRQVDPRAGALLDQLYPPRTLGEELVFAFDAGFIFEREVSDPKFIELVQKEAQGVLGPNVAISVRKQQGREPGTITLAEERERKRKEKLDLAIRKAQAHPVVQAAKSLLGADITQVRVPEEP